MKILFITPYLPSPPRFGGQRRLDGLLRGLAEKHEVSVLSLCSSGPDVSGALKTTQSYCRNVFHFPHDVLEVERTRKRVLQLRSLASRRSFESLLTFRGAFQAYLDSIVNDGGYDIVQVEFAQMGVYGLPRAGARPARFVLDEHNIEYEILKRTAETSGTIGRKLYNAVNWRKLRREERDAWRRFDGVSLTSARDEQLLLRDAPGTRTQVVPNGVDVEFFQATGLEPVPGQLLFFGALGYYPNTDGLSYFIDEIMPKVRALRPGARLRIVGPSPPSSIVSRQSDSVEVVGFVDDLRPELERASAVVVPLRIGGGTRLKIVEAMAMARPIVSTTLGAEGLDVAHDQQLLLADHPDAFAREVARLLDDPSLSERLGRAARRLAEERYSWRAAVAQLGALYDRLLAVPAKQS